MCLWCSLFLLVKACRMYQVQRCCCLKATAHVFGFPCFVDRGVPHASSTTVLLFGGGCLRSTRNARVIDCSLSPSTRAAAIMLRDEPRALRANKGEILTMVGWWHCASGEVSPPKAKTKPPVGEARRQTPFSPRCQSWCPRSSAVVTHSIIE